MEDNERYFNFPICFLPGLITDLNATLDDIAAYAIYKHLNKHHYEYREIWFQSIPTDTLITYLVDVADYFYYLLEDALTLYERGKLLADSIPEKSPHCGINIEIFYSYREGYKTDFDKACLVAFLAIKSILGNREYCKMTNQFLISRMAGNKKVVPLDEIHPAVLKFTTEYQLNKIKVHLRSSWHLNYYATRMRGFYVSFQLHLKWLVRYAEEAKYSSKVKRLKALERQAIEDAGVLSLRSTTTRPK